MLFRDPDFAPYLIFAPERHCTDKDREERVYHNMYTGAWWWFTQVSERAWAMCALADTSSDVSAWLAVLKKIS